MLFLVHLSEKIKAGDRMAFKIPKEEYVNRTFRLEKSLVDRMDKVCDKEGISLNRLTVLCIQYALDNMDEDPSVKDAKEK